MQSLDSQFFSAFAVGSTDAAGRTAVNVRLGTLAGPARLIVSVPILGFVDTARYTVLPGAAASVTVFPRDTALYQGRSYTLRGGVTDQFGNARSDPVAWTASAPGMSVTSAGVVTGLQFGRYTITGTAGTRSATASVGVVPSGRLTAWKADAGRIIAVDMDGSNYRELEPINDGGIGAHPRWIPGTNSVIYTHYDGTIQALHVAEEGGSVRRFFSTLPPEVSHQAEPQPSANGEWLYFSAYDTRCSIDVSVSTVRV